MRVTPKAIGIILADGCHGYCVWKKPYQQPTFPPLSFQMKLACVLCHLLFRSINLIGTYKPSICIQRAANPINDGTVFSRRKEVQGGTTETLWRLHLYDILTYKVFEDWSLEEENVFECELWIPDTEYSVTKELIYYPGKSMTYQPIIICFVYSLISVDTI